MSTPPPLCGWVVFTLICGIPVAGTAEVPDAVHQVEVGIGARNAPGISDLKQGSTALRTAASESFRDDTTLPPYFYEVELRALAETFGGSSPTAVASAEAQIGSIFIEDLPFYEPIAYASASALLTYTVHLRPTNTTGLVWQPSIVPFEFHATGEVSGMATASVTLRLGLTTLFSDTAAGLYSANPRLSFDRTVSLSAAPDSYFTVSLSASATARDTRLPGFQESVSSQAVADPTFAFDQAAFDVYAASQGQPTFNLAEHYTFEFSPGIVPEPATGALIALGVPVMWRRLRPAAALRSNAGRRDAGA